jgi:hypothetical protein
VLTSVAQVVFHPDLLFLCFVLGDSARAGGDAD